MKKCTLLLARSLLYAHHIFTFILFYRSCRAHNTVDKDRLKLYMQTSIK